MIEILSLNRKFNTIHTHTFYIVFYIPVSIPTCFKISRAFYWCWNYSSVISIQSVFSILVGIKWFPLKQIQVRHPDRFLLLITMWNKVADADVFNDSGERFRIIIQTVPLFSEPRGGMGQMFREIIRSGSVCYWLCSSWASWDCMLRTLPEFWFGTALQPL